jgi:digeranylgeranylglycerophospholipid reductase
MVTNQHPDVVIIGAGPAGAAVAQEIGRRADKTVVLIDRRREIGVPSRCAGGIGAQQLKDVGIIVPDRIITNEIYGMRLISPNKTEVRFSSLQTMGYILDRVKFDQWMVNLCDPDYVEVIKGQAATTDGKVVVCGDTVFKPRHIVIATGLNVKFANAAGIPVKIDDTQIHKCVQVTIPVQETPRHNLLLYFGNKIAPNGYAWIFPESDCRLRVGLGVSKATPHDPKVLLQRFIERMGLSGHPQFERTGKLIPTTFTTQALYRGKAVLVGDAAFQCDPLTGGGIGQAIMMGYVLGQVINDDLDYSIYQTAYYDRLRHKMQTNQFIKELLCSCRDEELDAFARELCETEYESVYDLRPAAQRALVRQKGMLWKAMKLRILGRR